MEPWPIAFGCIAATLALVGVLTTWRKTVEDTKVDKSLCLETHRGVSAALAALKESIERSEKETGRRLDELSKNIDGTMSLFQSAMFKMRGDK